MADTRIIEAENVEALAVGETEVDAWEAKYPYGWREQRTKLPDGRGTFNR